MALISAHSGVEIYVQNKIPAKMRYDLMYDDIEVLWMQINLPHLKPLLIGCSYRPPNAKLNYLGKLCEMLDTVGDFDNEIYFLGDLNIDWNMPFCPLKEKLMSITNASNLVQMVDKPT